MSEPVASVLIATCREWPAVSASDALYLSTMRRLGLRVSAAPWNSLPEPFLAADLVVLRSTWDYHQDVGAFIRWLELLERHGIQVLNPPAMVRWNLDKHYLLDIRQTGVAIPETRMVPREPAAIRAALGQWPWPRAVIKPAIGASGHGVRLLERAEFAGFAELIDPEGSPIVIQEFVAEITPAGEFALVFFDGQFSHAFVRQPRPGEFRVNSQYGGVVAAATVPERVIADAQRALTALSSVPLYCRVDGVVRGGQLVLMELEVIEPGLALDTDRDAADRFATATLGRLNRQRASG